jgi:hypothetical protein
MEAPPCSGIRRINIVKIGTLSKAIYMTEAIPVKIPTMVIVLAPAEFYD